jgi:hypothetical protein
MQKDQKEKKKKGGNQPYKSTPYPVQVFCD